MDKNLYEANVRLVDENKYLKHDLEVSKNRLKEVSRLLKEYIEEKDGDPDDEFFIPVDNVAMAYKISKGMATDED